MPTQILTIGFTQTSAETFFARLKASKAKRLVDVRLNNLSQLSGFAKRDDLRFFTREIVGIEYVHETELAPTDEMLKRYQKKEYGWEEYARAFVELLRRRKVEALFSPSDFDGACFLCSELNPHHCHRRLVAEYLREHWKGVEILHL